MKTKISIVSVLIAVLSIFLFIGCNQNETSKAEEPLVLNAYDVPMGIAKEVLDDINGLLLRKEGEPTIGSARLSPDGQILVAAPKSFHAGVSFYIKKMNENNLGPTPAIEVHYWIVAGIKAEKFSKLDDFKAIKPALNTIQNNQGPMDFKLLDHIATTSSGQGSGSELASTNTKIRQTLYAYHDGSVIIEPTISWSGRITRGGLKTKILIKSGELIVLGQMSQEFKGLPIFNTPIDGKEHEETVNVYYIVTAEVRK